MRQDNNNEHPIDPVLIAGTMQHRQMMASAVMMTMLRCFTAIVITIIVVGYALPQVLQSIETIARISH